MAGVLGFFGQLAPAAQRLLGSSTCNGCAGPPLSAFPLPPSAFPLVPAVPGGGSRLIPLGAILLVKRPAGRRILILRSKPPTTVVTLRRTVRSDRARFPGRIWLDGFLRTHHDESSPAEFANAVADRCDRVSGDLVGGWGASKRLAQCRRGIACQRDGRESVRFARDTVA